MKTILTIHFFFLIIILNGCGVKEKEIIKYTDTNRVKILKTIPAINSEDSIIIKIKIKDADSVVKYIAESSSLLVDNDQINSLAKYVSGLNGYLSSELDKGIFEKHIADKIKEGIYSIALKKISNITAKTKLKEAGFTDDFKSVYKMLNRILEEINPETGDLFGIYSKVLDENSTVEELTVLTIAKTKK